MRTFRKQSAISLHLSTLHLTALVTRKPSISQSRKSSFRPRSRCDDDSTVRRPSLPAPAKNKYSLQNRRSSSPPRLSMASHFLLYLNQQTYGGSEGASLEQQIRRAWDAKLKIVMIHEKDPGRGGCEFSNFFLTTPQKLIEDGLYSQIAIPFEGGDGHRNVSRALLAKALGGKVSSGLEMFQNASVQGTAQLRRLTPRLSSFHKLSRQSLKLRSSLRASNTCVRDSACGASDRVSDQTN